MSEEIDELRRLFGVSDLPDAAPKASDFSADPADAGPVSPTCLEVGAWGMARGRELRSGSDVIASLAHLNEDADYADMACADFYAAAFDIAPRFAENPEDTRRADFLRSLLSSTAFAGVRASSSGWPEAAEIAAESVAVSWNNLMAGSPVGGGRGVAASGGDDETTRTAAAAAAAASAAETAVEELREACGACGMGPGATSPADSRAVASNFRRVRNSPFLRRLVDLAGRYRRVAASQQKMKVVHGTDEVVGFTLGGDITRATPTELVSLAHPVLRRAALARLASSTLLVRDHQTSEPVGKGPIIVTLDESGSMAGEKIAHAKALALALAWVAAHQGRWVGLVAYSGDTGSRLLSLAPRRWKQDELLVWADQFIGKGSTMDVPVRELPAFYASLGAPRGKTDVVMITDAACSIPGGVAGAFIAWKSAVKATVTTLVIGNRAGDLRVVSDVVHMVPMLSPGNDAVGSVLSI